jgi:hypothetical protein
VGGPFNRGKMPKIGVSKSGSLGILQQNNSDKFKKCNKKEAPRYWQILL